MSKDQLAPSDAVTAVCRAAAEQAAADTLPPDTIHVLAALAGAGGAFRANQLLAAAAVSPKSIAGVLPRLGDEREPQGASDGASAADALAAVGLSNASPSLCTALAAAADEAQTARVPGLSLETLLLGLTSRAGFGATRVLTLLGLRIRDLRTALAAGLVADFEPKTQALVDQFDCRLLGLVRDPLIGRDGELDRLATLLARSERNNPLLVGPEGVGKRALVSRLAWLLRHESDRWPAPLAGSFVVHLDLAAVAASGAARLEDLVARLAGDGHTIALLTSLRALSLNPTAIAAHLRPALDAGRIRAVLSLTPQEAKSLAGLDPELAGLFEQVPLGVVPTQYDGEIAHALADRYADYHHVSFAAAAVESAGRLGRRYLRSEAFPGSLAGLLDDVAARVGLDGRGEVEEGDVTRAVSMLSGVPVDKLTESELDRVQHMEEHLHERIVGQDEAVAAVSKAIRRAKAGMKDAKRPIGSFVFAGPTGVGKTELARTLASFLFGDDSSLLQFDMSEYGTEGDVTKLIGAGPEWVGHEEGGQLTNAVKARPYAVLLFDEVEKAHPKVFDLFLQLLEEGHLTDGSGERVDFANTVVIMTSNLGMQQALNDPAVDGATGDGLYKLIRTAADRALHEFFRPELLNRLDAIVIFHPLERAQLDQIAALMAADLGRRSGFTIVIERDALERVLAQGYDPKLGARPLRRAFATLIEDPLADLILAGKATRGDTIRVSVRKDALALDRVAPEPAAAAT